MFLVRLVLLPFKLAFALVAVALRLGYRVGRLPVRVSGRAARLLGVRGWFFLLLGLAVGLLVAPRSGRELRERLQARLRGGVEPDDDLAERVEFELAHAPRTWHLPQPAVSVAGGHVTLRGRVPAEDTRLELGRVAGTVPGVTSVDNLLDVVPGSADAPDL